MLCLGCGREIPFVGAVCPYCQRDKSGSSFVYIVGMALGGIGALFGYLIGDFGTMLGGGFIGTVVGCILALVMLGKKITTPPEVRIQGSNDKEVAPPQTIPIEEYRSCPFCAEPIRRAAIKCRYCGSAIPSDPPPPE